MLVADPGHVSPVLNNAPDKNKTKKSKPLLYSGKISPQKHTMIVAATQPRHNNGASCNFLYDALSDENNMIEVQGALGKTCPWVSLCLAFRPCDPFLKSHPRLQFAVGSLKALVKLST